MSNRRGVTLVELLFTLLLFGLVFLVVFNAFMSGRSSLEVTDRKVEATGRTHALFEQLRHDLETCEFAWAPPSDEKPADSG